MAVYGAPRHSQRFGAKHAFWPWPKHGGDGYSFLARRSGIDAGESVTDLGRASPTVSVRGTAGGGQRGGGGGRGGVCGVEVPVPGVVSDSDYRLCLSTGLKFTDMHLATVLDSSRVLVDEMMVADSVEGVRTVLLSS